MSTAAITIEQGGVRGPASTSRDDLVTGLPVKLRNANDSGVRSWRWKLTLPKGSSAALTNVVAAAPEFTPDVPGTYVVELAVDEALAGQTDKRLAIVRLPAVATASYGSISPRFIGVGESDEANFTADFGGSVGVKTNDTGWWEDLDRWLRILADLAAGAGGAGGRPVTNAAPTIAGASPLFTYAIPPDEIGLIPPTPGSGDLLRVDLPSIAGLDPGQVIGVQMPSGFGPAVFDVSLDPNGTDSIIDPATGFPPAGPPGLPLVYTAGSLPAGALLVFEGVQGPSPAWRLRYDLSTLSGGGGDWATVLAAGNESGGTDARMTDEDRIEWNPDVPLGPGPAPPVVRGWKTGRRADLPGLSGGATNIGGAVTIASAAPGSELLETDNLLTLRIQAARRTVVGPATVSQDYAVIERVYSPTSAGGLSIVRTITYENPGDWLDVVNTAGSIFLQADDGVSPAEVYAMVEVLASPGRNFS